jgi:biotin carboxyl carrier protein
VKAEIKVLNLVFSASVSDLGDGQYSIALRRDGQEETVPVCVLNKQENKLTLSVDNKIEEFLIEQGRGETVIYWRNRSFSAEVCSGRDLYKPRQNHHPTTSGKGSCRAEMPGKIVRILKANGESVGAGEGIVVVEAMKMQNEILSPVAGTVVNCQVREGQTVDTGDLLFEIENQG